MAIKMLHTCIRVTNLEKSIQFYKDVLGLVVTREIDHMDKGFKLVYLSSCKGEYEIELTFNEGTTSYEIGNGFSHVAIGVDDLEKSYENHKSRGYDVTNLSSLSGNVPSFYFIKDPDGYMVEIIRNK